MIVVIDYGVGNLGSMANMLKKIGVPAKISGAHADMATASKLILPGVGRFDAAMGRLRESGLIPLLRERVLEARIPVLGVCLGAQLLGRGSQEGDEPGLGLLAMDAKRFPEESGLPIPHMGWREVTPRRASPLFAEAGMRHRFYFAHSYYLRCDDENDVVCDLDYGVRFAACVGRDNIHGAQFHPEKSHRFGMALLANFTENA